MFQREYKRRLVLVKFVMDYLNSVRWLFKWSLSFDWQDYKTLKVIYKRKKEEYIIIPIMTKGYESPNKEIEDIVQDFILSMYYEYERDGKEVSLTIIGKILWISQSKTYVAMDNIKSKLTKKQHFLDNSILEKDFKTNKPKW